MLNDNQAMESDASNPVVPKRKRRRFQFSLRTLMLFVLIAAIPCAWVGRRLEEKRREREAVAAIRAHGGYVWYDDQAAIDSLGIPAVSAPSQAAPSGPAWLRAWLGDDFFTEVTVVDLFHADFEDEDALDLIPLAHVQSLNLALTRIGDSGAKVISRMTDLRSLFLYGAQVNDATLARIGGLTHLESLDLRSTEITNAGLVHLQRLHQLKALHLCNTEITDAGVASLKTLTQLQYLDVRETHLTKAALDELSISLPQCQFCVSLHDNDANR